MADACPDCPVCGHPPKFRLSEAQVFCGNDDCRALSWNPSITQAANFADMSEVDVDE